MTYSSEKKELKSNNPLDVRGISVAYGLFSKIYAVTNLTFTIDRMGKCVALVGPNGAGKSTTIKAVLGLIKLGEGSTNHAGKIAYLPENASIYQYLSCRENVEFYVNASGGSGDPMSYLDTVGMSQLAETPAYKLSKGQRRKLNLAMILSSEADIICLDEPFEGLDSLSSYELAMLIDTLKSSGKSFLVSSHALNLVEKIADEVLFMKSGTLVSGKRSKMVDPLIIEFTSSAETAKEICNRNGYEYRVLDSKHIMVSSKDPPQVVLKVMIESGLEVLYSRKSSLEETYRNEYGE